MLQRSHKQRFEITDRRRITFYPCVFNTEARIKERSADGEIVTYREVIRPGAFTATLDEWGEVVANLDHDDAKTFARRSDGTLLLQEDPHGLWASCWIPVGEFGDGILADIQSGKLDGCSFKFGPVETRTSNNLVERIAVSLHDVCLTAYPAYEGTEVTHHRTRALQRANFLFTKLRLLKLKANKLHNNN